MPLREALDAEAFVWQNCQSTLDPRSTAPLSKRDKGQRRKDRAKVAKAKLRREKDRTWRRERYPQFIFHDPKGIDIPEPFVRAVKRAARSIRFDDRSLCSRQDEAFMCHVKMHGIASAITEFRGTVELQEQLAIATDIAFTLGAVLFWKLRPTIALHECVPYYDVSLRLSRTDIEVDFDGLLRDKTPGGTVYFSSSRPTIEIEGHRKVVAFSRHAIEQLRDRRVQRWDTYHGAAEAFTYVSTWRRFDLVQSAGNMLLAVYNTCSEGFLSYRYVEHVMGESCHDAKLWYRLGYLPMGMTEKYASAITLLTPGMRGTPERDLLDRASLSRGERQRIVEGIENAVSHERLFETMDFSALRWFHENGVPQVVVLDESPFNEVDVPAGREADVEGALRLLATMHSQH